MSRREKRPRLPAANDRLSRYLSMLLRHRPQVAGVVLDPQGWVLIPDLVEAVNRHWKGPPTSPEEIIRLAESDAKGRYEVESAVSPARIRATYGHSVPIRIQREAVTPPAVLYHGTARRFLDQILREGLHPMQRLFVHLTADRETAEQVGRRRDPSPVILEIDAAAMHAAARSFYTGPGEIYLTEYVPADFIRTGPRPDCPRSPAERSPAGPGGPPGP